jgi:hypothetical protein
LDTSEPHDPENNCIMAPEELKLLPMLLKVIVTLDADDKLNEYHTSSSGVPVAHPTGIPELAVAPLTV